MGRQGEGSCPTPREGIPAPTAGGHQLLLLKPPGLWYLYYGSLSRLTPSGTMRRCEDTIMPDCRVWDLNTQSQAPGWQGQFTTAVGKEVWCRPDSPSDGGLGMVGEGGRFREDSQERILEDSFGAKNGDFTEATRSGPMGRKSCPGTVRKN